MIRFVNHMLVSYKAPKILSATEKLRYIKNFVFQPLIALATESITIWIVNEG